MKSQTSVHLRSSSGLISSFVRALVYLVDGQNTTVFFRELLSGVRNFSHPGMGTQIMKVQTLLEGLEHINFKEHPNYFASLLEDPSDVEMINDELARFCSEGNEHFKSGQFKNAVERYSLCMKLGVPFLPGGSVEGLEIRRDILAVAASNRAQALLNVRQWEYALLSSKEALELDPNHVKSMYRKAKALQGLQEYRKACSALEYALEFRPNNKQIKDTLNQCESLDYQSVTGEYDLAQIICCGGYAPLFADFVGPVEIRSVASCGRGLFLTKAVEPGELLMAINAFAFGGSESKDTLENFRTLIEQLMFKCSSSKRFLHQFHYLRGDDDKDYTTAESIPPMELFIPGSNWSPDPHSNVGMPSIEEAYGKAKVNSFDALRSVLPVTIGEGKDDIDQYRLSEQMSVTGVWILPSFINHSCAPNCSTQNLGGAMFIRAAESMLAGEELTISYIATEEVDREKRLSSWNFKCTCARCVQDDWVRPLIKELLDEAEKQVSVLESTSLPEDAFLNCCHLIAGIENVIKNLPIRLDEKQKIWIRVAFQKIYFYMLRFEAVLDGKEKIYILCTILRGYDSINMGIGGVNLQMAVSIMHAIELEYSESSKEHHEARRELERQFTKTLGTLKQWEIEELLRIKFTADNLWYDMKK